MNKLWVQILLLIAIFSAVNRYAWAEEQYVLGNGDIVRISVYGQNDLNTISRINEANKITFPLIGEVVVGGYTPSGAEKRIAAALEKGGFVRAPQVNVIIEQYRSRQVAILGEVNKPGKYSIDTPSKLIDILTLAGGVTREGADVIRLIRKDSSGAESQQAIDLYEILNQGNMQKNLDVQNNDIIFVPVMNRFYIYGEVQRPGVFRLERKMTVMQAIAVGGGITTKGTERGIKIRRTTATGENKEIDAELTALIEPNDVIYVKESLF